MKKYFKVTFLVSFLFTQLVAFAQPENDFICNAIPLSISTGCSEYSNVNASISETPFTPSCWDTDISNDVWFSFIAIVPGMTVSTDLQGLSLTNTQVAVYSSSNNTCAGTLTQIACDEDSGTNEPDNSIIIMPSLIPGNVYYIRVDGNGADMGSFCISVADTYTPGSTPCEAQIVYPNSLSCAGGFFGGGGGGDGNFAENALIPAAAYPPLGVDYCGGDDETNQYGAWTTFIATTTEITMTNYSGGAREHTLFTVADVNDCSNLTCDSTYATSDDGTTTVSGLTLGDRYYVLTTLTGGSTSTGFSTDICFQSAAACIPPSNDDCANAQTIVADKLYGVTTHCATSDSPPSVCEGTRIDNNIWFNWTTPADWTGDAFFQLFNQNCTPGNQSNGSQAYIYSPGLTCGDVADCSGGATSNNDRGNQSYDNNITAAWTPVPDSTYLINFDGYAGEVCSMQFQVTSTASTKVVSVNSVEICSGESAWLFASGASAYTWSTGETTDSILVSPTITTPYVVSAAGAEIGTATGFVIVKPTPSLSSDLSPEACSGNVFDYEPASTTPLPTFTWTRAAVPGISNLADSGAGNPNETLINTTKDSVNVEYVFVSTAKTCTNAPIGDTVLVTVRPEALIPTHTTTICNREIFRVKPTDGIPTVATSIPVGTQYIWTAPSISPLGTITGASAETVPRDSIGQTLINTTFAVSTVTYSVTPVVDGCDGTPFNVIVTVRPSDNASFIYPRSTYCDDDNTTDSTAILTGGLPGGIFSASGGLIILDPLTGRFGLSTSPLATDTVKYVTNGTCPDSSYFSVTITDGPDATFTYPGLGPTYTYCQNTANPSPNYILGASAGVFTVNPVGGLSIDILTGEIDLSTSLSGTYTVTNYIDSIPGTQCPANIDSVVVRINFAPSMTNPAIPETICSEDVLSIALVSDTITSLAWKATNNIFITGESTANQSATTIADVLTNTSLLAQSLSYTVTPTSSPEGCVGTPQVIDVTINPKPLVTSSVASFFICSEDTVASKFTVDVPSTFLWMAADNSFITGDSIAPQVTDSLNNILINTSTAQQTVNYAITPTSLLGACVGNTIVLPAIVNPKPVLTNPTISPICSEDTVVETLNADVTSFYTWVAADNLNTTGESTDDQAGQLLSNTIINTSTAVQIVSYTVSARSAVGCDAIPIAFTVTVNPKPVVTSSVSSFFICSEDTVASKFTVDVPYTLLWMSSGNINITGDSIAPQTTDSLNNILINTSTAQQTVNYSITPRSSPQGCLGNTIVVAATVRPKPVLSAPLVNPICSEQTMTTTLNTPGVASVYTWVADDNPSTTGEITNVQSGELVSNTIVNNTPLVQTITYTVTAQSILGCDANPITFTASINPKPIMQSATLDSICSGDTISLPLKSDVVSTYSWSAIDGANTTGEITTSQATDTIINAIVNTTLSVQTISYTIMPTSIATPACVGNTQTVIVEVNPSPNANVTGDTLCGGGDPINIVLTADIPSTFTWLTTDNINTTGESTTAQNSDAINDAIVNTTLVNQTLSYTVTPTATAPLACVGETQIAIVEVLKPIAALSYTPEEASTPSHTVAFINESVNANTYEWLYTNDKGESVGEDRSNTLDPVSHTFTSASIYTASLIATFNSLCPDTAMVDVTVYKLVVSNVFTPNGDGYNDMFAINAAGLTSLSIDVYNRWGVELFSSQSLNGKWDGRLTNGLKATAGTYFYVVTATGEDGQEFTEKGFVTLLR